MAIHDSTNAPVSADAVAGNQAAPAAAPQQVQRNNNRWSFHDMGRPGFRSPLSAGMGSEYLNRLQVELAETYKRADSSYQITLVPVEREIHSLAFSALVVCMQDKTTPNKQIAFHVLVVEATGGSLPVETLNFNGVQVEKVLVAGDAVDKVYMERVSTKLRQAFPDYVLLNADACVVPSALNLDDKPALHSLARNAGLACATILGMHSPDFRELNLAESMHDSTLVVTQKYANVALADDVGAPMRSDVLVEFTSQKNKQQGVAQLQTLNSGESVEKVGLTSGFIDFLWAPVAPQNPYGAYAQMYQNPLMPMPQPTQKFAARLVLTHTHCNYLSTPAAILMQLGVALAVRDNNNWFMAFSNNRGSSVGAGKKKHYIHDVGALGYEANLNNDPSGVGSRVDTVSDAFAPEDLAKLLMMTVQPGLIVSFDVPECGPETWYSSFISAASNNNAEALEDLVNAANTLTNGRFIQNFAKGTPIFTDIGNRVHLGHYTDSDGVKRDLREIDYLAVANLMGDTDPKVLRDWTDTFNLTNVYPLEQRLAARLRIMKGLFPTVEVTGYATRVTFTEAFLSALARSFQEAGLNVRNVAPVNRNELFNERGTAGFVNAALMPVGQAGFFSYGTGPVFGGNGMGYAMPSARWY